MGGNITLSTSLANATTFLYQLDVLEKYLASISTPHGNMVYLGAPATHVTSTCLSPSGMLDKVAINFSLLVVLSSSNKLENFGKEISEGYSLICDKTSSYG